LIYTGKGALPPGAFDETPSLIGQWGYLCHKEKIYLVCGIIVVVVQQPAAFFIGIGLGISLQIVLFQQAASYICSYFTVTTKFSTMKRFFLIAILFVPLLLAAQTEEQKVEEAFNGYTQAIIDSDGKKAYELVDSNTKTYYGKVLDLALHGDKEALSSVGLLTKMNVLIFRHRVDHELMKGFDTRGMLVYAVDHGITGKDAISIIKFISASVDGHHATTKLSARGVEAPFGYDFNKEDGQWRIDITSVFEPTEELYGQLVVQTGQSEDEFIFALLGQVYGEMPDESIWDPIGYRITTVSKQ